MARVITKIGDVFSVNLGNGTKRYIQYVANDITQLNSDVIRGFSGEFDLTAQPLVSEVVNLTELFFAHTMVSLGVKMGLWVKEGKSEYLGNYLNALFRHTEQYGRAANEPIISFSDKWYVWRVGEEFKQVGKLDGANKNAYPGLVISPPGIVELLKGNKYPPLYPD
jgi:hypothetical protein